MPSPQKTLRSARSGPAIPAWVVAVVIAGVVGLAALVAARMMFTPPLRVEAERGSEGARWAELMKRTGGQGPVGTRPYAGEAQPQGGGAPEGH